MREDTQVKKTKTGDGNDEAEIERSGEDGEMEEEQVQLNTEQNIEQNTIEKTLTEQRETNEHSEERHADNTEENQQEEMTVETEDDRILFIKGLTVNITGNQSYENNTKNTRNNHWIR